LFLSCREDKLTNRQTDYTRTDSDDRLSHATTVGMSKYGRTAGFTCMSRGGSRVGEQVEAPQAPSGWGLGRGIPLPTGSLGRGCAPSRNVFEILSRNGVFLCILQQ